MIATKKIVRRFVSSLLIALALTACNKTIVESYSRPPGTQVESAYVKPGADFGRYTRLMSDGLEIYYPQSIAPPAEEDLQRIRAIFRETFLGAIGDDYQIVSEPGPDVLKVRAQLIDMKIIGRDQAITASGRLRNMVSRGELTFLMEMIDSTTGEVLARAGDRSADIPGESEVAEWTEVEAAARRWARLFRGWLDRSLKGN